MADTGKIFIMESIPEDFLWILLLRSLQGFYKYHLSQYRVPHDVQIYTYTNILMVML